VLSEVRRRKSGGASGAAQPPHAHSQQNGTGPAGMGGTAHLRHRTHAPANGRAASARAEVSQDYGHTHGGPPWGSTVRFECGDFIASFKLSLDTRIHHYINSLYARRAAEAVLVVDCMFC